MIEFKQKFIEDVTDLLIELEQVVLSLEKKPNDSKLIEEVFRAMHTIKGTAGMYGFTEIGTLTHRLENIFDLVRNGRIGITKNILDLTLKAIDFLNIALKADENHDFTKEYTRFYNQINEILNEVGIDDFDGNQREIEDISEHYTGVQTWFITIKPTDDLRNRGVKAHLLFDEITEAGRNHIFNRSRKKADGYGIFWELFLVTELQKAEIEDILLFVEDVSEIKHIYQGDLFDNNKFLEKLDAYIKIPEINIEDLNIFIEQQLEIEKDEADSQTNIFLENSKLENIKVSADRLDEQMTLLSELVTAQAEVQLIVQQNGYKKLSKSVEQMEKITRRFRKNIFKIRLLPFETLQLRFDRLIRDLSAQLNKNVDFAMEGMSTELDKNIIDSLESPLMHLIRNCLDHGIETAEVRKMRGKPGKGQIKLTARQAAANVLITVSDDGEGINATKIHEKAVLKGLVTKGAKLTETEIYDLIFTPGFSTAQNLTEISGRGVGMDIVKQTIHSLRGSISVYSEEGKGSSFTIKLPLNLSIMDTMLVRAGAMYYAIPLPVIDRCTEIKTQEIKIRNNNQIVIENELLPYLIISENLKFKHREQANVVSTNLQEGDPKSKIIIVNNESEKIALIVDEVIGEHQAVLKPIGNYFKHQRYLSGASILADGNIALILDITKLIV